jgi:hypothetical protein
MEGAVNTIRKQTIQFYYSGKTDGFALQKEVSDWCNFTLIPEIEKQLEVFCLNDNYLSIDKLEIEATVDSKDWKQKISDELIFALKQKLNKYKPAKSDNKKETTSKRAKFAELLIFYFKTGYLPWWGKSILEDDFKTDFRKWINTEMSTKSAEIFREQLYQIISQKVAERVVNQLPVKLFFKFVENIYKETSEIISQYEFFLNKVILKNISPEEKKVITKSVYSQLLFMTVKYKGNIEPELILPFLYEELKTISGAQKVIKPAPGIIKEKVNPFVQAWQELLIFESKKPAILTEDKKGKIKKTGKDPAIKKIVKQETESETAGSGDEKQFKYNKIIDKLSKSETIKEGKYETLEELKDGIFIDNAGAVIFAAFLPALFKKLELEKNGQLVKPDLAALIIQYCVSGNQQMEEYELVLAKILCGLDVEYPVNTTYKISKEQIAEVNEMLQSLIEYWSALQNTSVEGLRESFLIRSGKLSFVNDEWLLLVEQKSFDMLLERIPWSISMIKLPWMTNILKTEWV